MIAWGSTPTMKAIKLAALMAVLLLSGCSGVRIDAMRSAEGYKPVLYLDPKPQLVELTPEEYADFEKLNENTKGKIETNMKALQADSVKIRKVVDRYNIWAGTSNEITAKNMGLVKGGEEDGK